MMGKGPSVISLAESRVPIETVLLDLYGIDIPFGAGDWKANCPLDKDHSDGGQAKAMRVYSDSNTAWCFSHSKVFTPLSLWQLRHGELSKFQAAKALLTHYDIDFRPKTPEQRWNDLNEAPEIAEADRDTLGDTLQVYARSLPGYSTHQYEDEVLYLMSHLLRSLETMAGEPTYDRLSLWLKRSKETLNEYWRKRDWN